MNPTTRDRVTRLDETLSELDVRLARALERAEHAERVAARVDRRLARGTEPHPTIPAAEPTRPGRIPPLGDDGPTKELNDMVEALIRERPLSRADLVSLTGARDNRVAAAIVYLQRKGVPIANVGTPRKALWFVLPLRRAADVPPALRGSETAKLVRARRGTMRG